MILPPWNPGPMIWMDGTLNLWRFGPRQYRCAQPVPDAIDSLARSLRLTTLLDLTEDGEHDAAAESAACLAVPINSARVPMAGAWPPPTQLQIDEALVYLGVDMELPTSDRRPTINANAPGCLIHCTHGEDRSGVVCACYQLAVGLPLDAVVDDFRRGHRTLDGAWGEYWFIWSILEFARRLHATARPTAE